MKWKEMAKSTKALVVLLILAIIGSVLGGLGNLAVGDTLSGVLDLVIGVAYIVGYVGVRKRASWAPLLVIVVAIVDVILAIVANDSGAIFGSVIFSALLIWLTLKEKKMGAPKKAGDKMAMEKKEAPMASEEEQEEEGEDDGAMPAASDDAMGDDDMAEEEAEEPMAEMPEEAAAEEMPEAPVEEEE